MREKAVAILLATTFMISVSACGNATETADIPASETVESTGTAEAMEEPTEAIEVGELPEAMEATEIAEKPAFTVTAMSATKYAKSNVNVRMGPSSDYKRLGGLSINQRVTVTGQADTGWYRIEFNGREAYVSNMYLTDEKVAVTAGANTVTASEAAGTATAQTQNIAGNNAAIFETDTTNTAGNPSSNAGSVDNGTASTIDNNTTGMGDAGETEPTGTENASNPLGFANGSNSGETWYGEDAQWAIDSGLVELGGAVINEDGSVTIK